MKWTITTIAAILFILFSSMIGTAQSEQTEIKGVSYNQDTESFTVFFSVAEPVELVVLKNGAKIPSGESTYLPYKGCHSVIVRADAAVGNIFVFSLVNERGIAEDGIKLDRDLICSDSRVFSGLMQFTPCSVETAVRNLDYDYAKKRFMLSVDVAVQDAPVRVSISKPDESNFCLMTFEVGGRYRIPVPLELEGRDEKVDVYVSRQSLQRMVFGFGCPNKDADTYPKIVQNI